MYERLLDKSHTPDFSELARYCGENKERFEKLNEYLSDQFATSQEIRFPYGNQYGWCVTHRQGKKLVCDIFAEAGAFNVMLRLSDGQFMALYAQLTESTQRLVDNRYPCGSGGWIHARITCEDEYNDIRLLLDAKCGRV